MKSYDDICLIVNEIKFNDWNIVPCAHPLSLRIVAATNDNRNDGDVYVWSGRRLLLSYHMTEGEIVQTAWLAVQLAIAHEAREQFTYKGVTVFDPHYDINRLVELRLDPTSIAEREVT